MKLKVEIIIFQNNVDIYCEINLKICILFDKSINNVKESYKFNTKQVPFLFT